jgi:hypothetical protein
LGARGRRIRALAIKDALGMGDLFTKGSGRYASIFSFAELSVAVEISVLVRRICVQVSALPDTLNKMETCKTVLVGAMDHRLSRLGVNMDTIKFRRQKTHSMPLKVGCTRKCAAVDHASDSRKDR